MSSRRSLAEQLHEGVVIFDGAMGTEIYRRNVLTNVSFDELCLSMPKLIRGIHEDYRAAGADVLTTNTFGANRVMLAKFGLADQTHAINDAGARLAREVADAGHRPMYVAGSVGPVLPERRETCDIPSVLREHARYLIEGGVDVILFETQRTRADLEHCAAAMAGLAGFPFILSFSVYEDCESCAGESLERMLAPMPEGMPSPIAWGLNCAIGPDALLTAAEKAMRLIDRPLILQPNAGVPREVGGRQIYFCSPDYMAGYAQRYLAIGVSGMGGCCGTTPDHIREVSQRIKPLAQKPKISATSGPGEGVSAKPETPLAEKSRFSWRLAHKKWVTTVEILPPRGYDLGPTLAKAQRLHRHGIDAINIPDGPRASSRLSPLVAAVRIRQEAQIEPILHFCCRDRNLIGMQADLLACAACEVRNLLFITGDPPKLGNYPFASGVFDVDSIGICRIQKRLNQGIDLGGQELDAPTHGVIGVGADPNALDMDREIRRFHEKVDAGAEFAITQPIFEPASLFRFLDAIGDCPIPILAGIWPLANLRNATFLRNEVPGVIVPDEIIDRMASVEDKEDQRKIGIAIAREMIDQIRDRIGGVQVSAPFGNIETALAVTESGVEP